MDIGIKQLLTQIVGFILLFWLLKKFAWGPLLAMMDARKQKILDDFAKVEKARADVEKIRDDLNEKLAHIDQIAREKEALAISEGHRVSTEMQTKARAEAHEILEKAKTSIELEVSNAKMELRNQIVTLSMAAAEKVIKDQLDEARHRKEIEDFIDEIGQLK